MALVGGGASPAFPPNTAVVWDCKAREEVSRIEWSTEIMSVKFLRNYLFVGACGKIFVYDPQTLEFIKSINDVFPLHICVAVTPAAQGQEGAGAPAGGREDGLGTLVTEGRDGHIKVGQFLRSGETAFDTRDYMAHNGSVVCVAVSADGRYCATASDKGTLIRIFSKDTGEKKKELRRGSSQAAITSITFSQDNAFLATTSNHGTVHVFATGLCAGSNPKNTKSWFGMVPMNITQSEWSPCSFTVEPNSSLCFITDSNGVTRLIVIKESGDYSSYLICTDKKGVTASEEGTPVNLLTFSV